VHNVSRSRQPIQVVKLSNDCPDVDKSIRALFGCGFARLPTLAHAPDQSWPLCGRMIDAATKDWRP